MAFCGEKWAIHAGQWAWQRGHKSKVDMLPQGKHVSGVGNDTQTSDERITVPIGLEDTKGNKPLSTYSVAVVRNSDLPALLGINSLEEMSAVVRCRTGEMLFLHDEGCDVKPKGNHVYLQMKKASSGHWFLPVGRFSNAMKKMAGGHLATTSSTTADAAAATATAAASSTAAE